ncbi:MAG: hypothetical protein ABEJ91_00820 [Candidatus Nanohaloarchaea archaeon]
MNLQLMEFDFDGSYVLYALGVLLGVSSIFYFGFEILLSFSPVTKALLLLTVSAVLILSGLRFSGSFLVLPFYLLGGFSYVVFVAYTMAKFGFSRELDFLLLAFSSAAFLALGYYIREGDLELGQGAFRKSLAVLALTALALSAVDAMGPQPESSLALADSVNISSDETRIGTVKVENSFFLHRDADLPRYSGCAAGDQRLFIEMSDRPELMAGGSSEEVNLTLQVPRDREDGRSIEGVYSIERAEECPESPAGDTIYVFETERYD